jgi:hypothetical protein
MKKVLSIALVFIFVFAFYALPEADAGAKVFKNCTEVHKYYKGGITKYSYVKNKGGKTYYKPYANKSLYLANSRLDRDKDLIACER